MGNWFGKSTTNIDLNANPWAETTFPAVGTTFEFRPPSRNPLSSEESVIANWNSIYGKGNFNVMKIRSNDNVLEATFYKDDMFIQGYGVAMCGTTGVGKFIYEFKLEHVKWFKTINVLQVH